jgi:ferredoxin
MTAPLPRVYEEGPGGKAVPQGPAPGQPSNIGGEFRVEELLRISKETVRACPVRSLRPQERLT